MARECGCAAGKQKFSGRLHMDGFGAHLKNKEDTSGEVPSFLEQGTGVEPASEAWET
jgi:hypothetical protein